MPGVARVAGVDVELQQCVAVADTDLVQIQAAGSRLQHCIDRDFLHRRQPAKNTHARHRGGWTNCCSRQSAVPTNARASLWSETSLPPGWGE